MRTQAILTLPLCAALGLSGCGGVMIRSRGTVRASASVGVVVPQRVVVRAAPPPPVQVAVVRPMAPDNTAVWVDGHYKWEGAWVWVEGHYESGHPNEVWVAPVAHEEAGTVVYRPGFWCPRGQEPPPEYQQPGTVRVSVRPMDDRQPQATATVRPMDDSRGTATVRPMDDPPPPRGATVRPMDDPPPPRGATVRPMDDPPPPRGTATARGSAPSDPPPRGGRTSVRVGGSVSGSATVRVGGGGSSSGSTGSGGGTPPRATGGTVRGRGEVNRGDDSVAEAAPRTSSPGAATGSARTTATSSAPTATGSARTTNPTTPGTATGSARTTNPTTPGTATGSARTTNPTTPGTATGSSRVVTPGTVGTVRTDERGTDDRQMALTCSISDATVPRRGLINIRGSAFTDGARVRIGGRVAVIVGHEAQSLRVQAPEGTGGGPVVVTDRGQSATCGSIQIR